MANDEMRPVKLVSIRCSVCGSDEREKIGSGYDFEYLSCPDLFVANRCRECTNVYLDPRPDLSEFERIYPQNYHSLDFSEKNYSFVHEIRSRLEANRLLSYCKGIPDNARILDVGCGDGFHLKLLNRFHSHSWNLEGVDIDFRAMERASNAGFKVHLGSVEDIELPKESYDLIYCIQTIEHVAEPFLVFKAIFRLLKPGGRLVIVTDNTDSLDFEYFKKCYWGGYHFPRHWNLFNQRSLTRLAERTGFVAIEVKTIVSPVNWVYSIHNFLVDHQAPKWLIRQFTLKSPITLGIFTLLDMVLQKVGRGALLNGFFQKPVQ